MERLPLNNDNGDDNDDASVDENHFPHWVTVDDSDITILIFYVCIYVYIAISKKPNDSLIHIAISNGVWLIFIGFLEYHNALIDEWKFSNWCDNTHE